MNRELGAPTEDRLSTAGGLYRGEAGPSSAWRSFVPDYVVRSLLAHPDDSLIGGGEHTDAVLLFADIAGFTPMSEALARSGAYGTEQLTGILNGWFAAMAERISDAGGSVAEFAGDALTAVFCCDRSTRRATVEQALQCALDMQAATGRFQAVATRAGSFGLGMKVGLAAGPLLLAIMGDPAIRLQYVLAGPALDRAAEAERHAHRGEVVVDCGLLEAGLDADIRERRDRWCVVGALRRGIAPVGPAPALSLAEQIDERVARRLAPFFHPAIAERLASGRHEFVGEHRKVTTAFVGLPALAADDPRSVAGLQRQLAEAVRVIDRYDGHLRQVVTGEQGSLLIAFFGAPVSHEDDEERAVRCSLELLQLPGGPFPGGVTTGSVYCGEVGSQTRREYAVIGDSINLASRLMQAAKPGQLLIDRPTHERVDEAVAADPLEPVTVKGKSGRIDIWAVRALRDRPGDRLPEPLSAAPLVGRDAELALVRLLIERALVGQGQVVCLTGDAGIGKSRLAAQIAHLARDLGTAVFGGACRSHDTTTSYLAWRSIWWDLLQLDSSLPIPERRAALVDTIASHDAGSSERAPLLAPVVNLPMPDSELTAGLDPQVRGELLRSLVLELLRERAASGPLLLMLEDCHWIDPASGVLLEYLARNVADQPVLLLVTARGTVADHAPLAPLSAPPHCSEFRLAELAGADAARLVGQRLRQRYGEDAAVSPDLVDRIAERGEGNPFYLEELVNYLHTRAVDPRDAGGLAAIDLPDGLQRLVMARIDQLSEGEKATIKVASVIGRSFRARWICESYPAAGPAKEISRHLERLHELDLTLRQTTAGPEPEYKFKHAITQEAAYHSLTFQLREALHERVGLFVERTYPDRLPQYAELLAYHYGRTQRLDKQRVWFRAAGDAAKATFANEAAVEYYQRLLALLPEDQTGEVLIELGGVWHLTGHWAEAERTYRRAIRVASRQGLRDVLAASQRDLGDLLMYTQSYGEAVRWLTRAAEEFERLGDRQGSSKTLERITYALYQQGAYDQALAAAERHLAMATEGGDLAGVSIALNHTGLVRMNTGQTAAALALLEEALDVAIKAGDRRYQLHAACNLGLVHWRRGVHTGALRGWQQALKVAQEIGSRQGIGLVIGNMGEVYREQGDYAGAKKCFLHALRIGLELRDWTTLADQVTNVATTAAAQGDDREAEQLFGQAIALARRRDAPYFLAGSLHQLAKLHADRGRLDEATRLNAEALEVANQHNERDIQVRTQLLSVRLQVARGRMATEEAVRRLRGLEGAWTELHERAALLHTLWDLDPTEETREAAAELYRALYQQAPSVECRQAYARLTGTRLPPGPPLPPLPALVDEPVDVETLLQQVTVAAGELRAA